MLKPRLYPLYLVFLLAGCSFGPDIPAFSASGYLADRGAVRIWRKNDNDTAVHLRTVYTPFNGDAMETTDYLWRDTSLMSVERHVDGKQPDTVTLRFDQDGGLNFMQRQLAERREAVSPDTIELYKFDAQRMLKVSDALLSGRVFLQQGLWQGGNRIETCEGQMVTPPFDEQAMNTLLQQRSGQTVSVSWLEAPEGVQLLRVGLGDDCRWQPKEADF